MLYGFLTALDLLIPQQCLQILHVIVLVAFDHCPTQPGSDPDACVIQLVGNDQTPRAH